MLKKFIPVVLLLAGVLVLVFAFLVVKKPKPAVEEEEVGDGEEEALMQLPLEKLPVVSLTPSADGHYLKLRIDKMGVEGAETLDFELLYEVPGDRPPQGIPGTNIKIQGKESFETDLLLGSESSGHLRYDEGVERGSITLKFRDAEGKLLIKLTSEFHLQSAVNELTSIDGRFRYRFEKIPKKDFFVVMKTLGIPGELPEGVKVKAGPYGVFSSLDKGLTGEIQFEDSGKVFRYDGEALTEIQDSKSSGFGIFFTSNS